MKKTIEVLNTMEREGLIERYVIAGGVAALFYMEPVLTYDLDVFCILPAADSDIVQLSPIYEWLKGRGYESQAEHVMIEGVPVQFIPAYNALVEEAVKEAKDVSYEGEPTRVPRAEHLIAIMLDTGRPKDRERISMMLDETVLDMQLLGEIVERHGLQEQWRRCNGESHEGE